MLRYGLIVLISVLSTATMAAPRTVLGEAITNVD